MSEHVGISPENDCVFRVQLMAVTGDFDGLADVALTPRERLALRRLPSEQRSSAALT